MNILHSIDNTHLGGIQELMYRLHLYDAANRHDVWAADGTFAPEMRAAGMVLWPGGPPAELIEGGYYDVIVGHGVGGWKYDDKFAWARQFGMKTLEVMHSNARMLTDPSLVDGLICLNHITREINRHVPCRTTIYGIVDPSLFSVRRSADYIGRLSRLAEEKRPYEFRLLADGFPDERFILAGDGPERSKIENTAPPNLLCVGMVRDFESFFGMLKLFVFPTRDECCCMSVAMAQAAGVPVVCQDIPPLRETTGEFAWFASSLDGFARHIGSADDPNVQQTALAAREWAWRNFHPEVVVAQWNEFLGAL